MNYFEDTYKKFDTGINIILGKLKTLNETTLYKDNKVDWEILCNRMIEELKSLYDEYSRYDDIKPNIDSNFAEKEQYISNIQLNLKQMNELKNSTINELSYYNIVDSSTKEFIYQLEKTIGLIYTFGSDIINWLNNNSDSGDRQFEDFKEKLRWHIALDPMISDNVKNKLRGILANSNQLSDLPKEDFTRFIQMLKTDYEEEEFYKHERHKHKTPITRINTVINHIDDAIKNIESGVSTDTTYVTNKAEELFDFMDKDGNLIPEKLIQAKPESIIKLEIKQELRRKICSFIGIYSNDDMPKVEWKNDSLDINKPQYPEQLIKLIDFMKEKGYYDSSYNQNIKEVIDKRPLDLMEEEMITYLTYIFENEKTTKGFISNNYDDLIRHLKVWYSRLYNILPSIETNNNVPINNSGDIFEIVSNVLDISIEEAKSYSGDIDENTLYASVPIKGGGSIIVDKNTHEFLYADSSIGYDMHLEEFRKGRRTPKDY